MLVSSLGGYSLLRIALLLCCSGGDVLRVVVVRVPLLMALVKFGDPKTEYSVTRRAAPSWSQRFFKAALSAEHCRTPIAPLRGVLGFVGS